MIENYSNIQPSEYKPSSHFFLDVNHAFSSILCDIVHGAKEGIYATTMPEKPTPTEQMMSHLFGVPAQSTKGVDYKDIMLQSKAKSRNGEVHKFDFPRLWTYTDPTSRVLQSRTRRCNPFFHLYEAMWFLAGKNDVASVLHFAKQIVEYSDDGETLNGAYGFRWRHHFGGDQLETVIQTLKKNPESRRCVLQMWDCQADLQDLPASIFGNGKPASVPYSKDVPCNTHCYVQMRNGELDLTVINRSNDIFWGMLGSNYVTFTFLLEYLAGMIGVPVGFYHHFSANAHYYTDTFPDKKIELMHEEKDYGVFVPRPARVPLVSTPENFDEELQQFVANPYKPLPYTERFFREVAVPMMQAHHSYKEKNVAYAIDIAKEDILQEDWKVACVDWLASTEAARKLTAPSLN